MKASTIPLICGIALTAMTTAGVSHWWSVRQFVTVMNTGVTMPASVISVPERAAAPPKAPAPKASQPLAQASNGTDPAPVGRQKEFYESLIEKMNSLQTQNRDLLDQLAETNRDLMKLEFRVDTHSESFRPLPVTEERLDTSFEDDAPGVLPPRAEPVLLPTHE